MLYVQFSNDPEGKGIKSGIYVKVDTMRDGMCFVSNHNVVIFRNLTFKGINNNLSGHILCTHLWKFCYSLS